MTVSGSGTMRSFSPLPSRTVIASVFKIHILDAQADALHQAQAGAVEKLRHEFVDAVQVVQEAADLVPGEDGGEALGPFGRGEEDGVNLFVEDFAVEEKNGAEGLVLGGGGDVPFHGQVGQEGLDFGGAHLGGVAFVVEEDEAAHPVHVGLFGAVGIMLEPQDSSRSWSRRPNLRFSRPLRSLRSLRGG
jgi:hypothetical protein